MLNKTLFLAFATLLVACPQPVPDPPPPPPAPPPASNPASVSGVVDGWTYGVQTLKVIAYTSNASTQPIVQTQIDASGAFSLTLPDQPTQVGPISFFPPTCTSIIQTPTSINGLLNGSFSVYGVTTVAGVIIQGDTKPPTTGQPTVGSRYVYRTFVDRDVTIKGSCGSTSGSDESWDVSLTKGWNAFLIEFTSTGIRAFNGPIPTNFKWFYSGSDPNPPSGSISNLRTQTTYCAQSTGLTTKFDFKFDVVGTITGYEVYISDPDSTGNATNPQAIGNVQGPVNSSFTITSSRVIATVTITPGTNDLPILGGFIGTVGLKWQAITVLPVTGTLWVRGKLAGGGFTPYLKASDPMALSSDAITCDPPFTNVP